MGQPVRQMKINWSKVNEIFRKADEMFKLLGEAVATEQVTDKSCGKDVWLFRFAKLPWKRRLQISWLLFKCSLGVLIKNETTLKLRKK